MDITRIISSGLGSDSSLHRNGKQKGQQQPADETTKGGTEGGLSFGVRHESESEIEGIGENDEEEDGLDSLHAAGGRSDRGRLASLSRQRPRPQQAD